MKNKYRMVRMPDHPRADKDGYVLEHITIAERALGRYLPKGAEVHHVNSVRYDNRPSNLVICQDHGYHYLLHKRERSLRGGGSVHMKKCWVCLQWDKPEAIRTWGKWDHSHASCYNKRRSEMGKIARGNKFPIQVSSGDLSKRVWAHDIKEAFKLFIERYQPKSLGVLVKCQSKHLDDIYYLRTENELSALGMWHES